MCASPSSFPWVGGGVLDDAHDRVLHRAFRARCGRVIRVGDVVSVASGEAGRPWLAHLVGLFERLEVQVAGEAPQRCTLRWLYGVRDVAPAILRESARYTDAEADEVFFSDSVEAAGSNALDSILGLAFLTRTGEAAMKEFHAKRPRRFMEGDPVRSIACFTGSRFGPIRSLDAGELKSLLENPSESRDLFRNSRPTMYGTLAVVMKGTGRASANYALPTAAHVAAVSKNAPRRPRMESMKSYEPIDVDYSSENTVGNVVDEPVAKEIASLALKSSDGVLPVVVKGKGRTSANSALPTAAHVGGVSKNASGRAEMECVESLDSIDVDDITHEPVAGETVPQQLESVEEEDEENKRSSSHCEAPRADLRAQDELPSPMSVVSEPLSATSSRESISPTSRTPERAHGDSAPVAMRTRRRTLSQPPAAGRGSSPSSASSPPLGPQQDTTATATSSPGASSKGTQPRHTMKRTAVVTETWMRETSGVLARHRVHPKASKRGAFEGVGARRSARQAKRDKSRGRRCCTFCEPGDNHFK